MQGGSKIPEKLYDFPLPSPSLLQISTKHLLNTNVLGTGDRRMSDTDKGSILTRFRVRWKVLYTGVCVPGLGIRGHY